MVAKSKPKHSHVPILENPRRAIKNSISKSSNLTIYAVVEEKVIGLLSINIIKH